MYANAEQGLLYAVLSGNETPSGIHLIRLSYRAGRFGWFGNDTVARKVEAMRITAVQAVSDNLQAIQALVNFEATCSAVNRGQSKKSAYIF